MQGVKGRFICKFSIGEKKDFINEENLLLFTLIEETGNILPQFQLVFLTNDHDLPLYLNEGNELEVTIGENINELENIKLIIFTQANNRVGDNGIKFALTGFYSNLDYLDTKVFITTKIDGATALKQVGSQFFKIDSNLTPNVSDTMYWRQYNISNKKFINDIWLATYIPDSFVAMGITITGNMIIRDVKKKLASGTTDWDLSNTISQTKNIDIDGNYLIASQTGFINAWLGSGREKFLYEMDEALGLIQNEKIDPLMSLTRKLMVNANREKKNFENGVINENVHSNYWKAYLRNITSLAIFSTIKLTFSFQNSYKKIKILDTVLFKEFDTRNKKSSSAEYSAGTYIVTKIVRKIQNRTLFTICQACRESFNQPKGGLK